MDVFLFIPCFIDQLFPDVGVATVNILKDLNCTIIYPEQQTCCGQPAFNSGYEGEASQLAERFIRIFEGAEYIVAPSGSCVTMVKKFYGNLHLSQSAKSDWSYLSERIYELSEFLISVLNIDRWEGYFPSKITYHDSCHALRELHVKSQPRKLLESVDGIELIEMENSEMCCGFGGTFSVKFPQISTAMVQRKAGWIQQSNPDIVVSTDSSCLMNISGYLQDQKIPIKSMHFAEVLWQSRENLRKAKLT